MSTKELDRIARMESYLNDVTTLTTKLQEQLDAMKAAESHAKELFSYYGSEDWHGCFFQRIRLGWIPAISYTRQAAYRILQDTHRSLCVVFSWFSWFLSPLG